MTSNYPCSQHLVCFMFLFQQVPACLMELPGVFCTTELHIEADFNGKVLKTFLCI